MCKTVLCVDIGTTSLKSALITKTGEVVSFSVCKIKDYEEGYIAKVWLSSFYKTIHSISKDLLKKSINVEILAFCVSGNGPTVVTKNGRTVLWNQKIQTEENQNKQSQ